MSRARAYRIVLTAGSLLLLSACAVPLSVTALSLAAGGLSYATTGKSMTDNYLSYFTNADCAMHRIVIDNTPICIIQPETAVAEADPDPALDTPIFLAGGADDSVIFAEGQ